jgi:hypothetical protein
MFDNAAKILEKNETTLSTWLFFGFRMLPQALFEYIKLVKLAMCYVLRFVENECCFNTLSFMKVH